jgi:hypothetical protein
LSLLFFTFTLFTTLDFFHLTLLAPEINQNIEVDAFIGDVLFHFG